MKHALTYTVMIQNTQHTTNNTLTASLNWTSCLLLLLDFAGAKFTAHVPLSYWLLLAHSDYREDAKVLNSVT